MSTIAIGPILVLLLIVVALIIGVTLWITGGSSKRSGQMSCGACGYAVHGLTGLNCPECGADLRKVGINRSGGGNARGVGIALTIGTSLLLLTCLGSAFFFVQNGAPTVPASQSMPAQPPAVKQTTISSDLIEDASPEDEDSGDSVRGEDPAEDAATP